MYEMAKSLAGRKQSPVKEVTGMLEKGLVDFYLEMYLSQGILRGG